MGGKPEPSPACGGGPSRGQFGRGRSIWIRPDASPAEPLLRILPPRIRLPATTALPIVPATVELTYGLPPATSAVASFLASSAPNTWYQPHWPAPIAAVAKASGIPVEAKAAPPRVTVWLIWS